ncbi:MAG: DNA repair protein RecO [Eubacterium sp.]|jgi:DNA repair protein RecO (recombination protein O)|nr:DNA repair protein RecO [Eubacterium sp.]
MLITVDGLVIGHRESGDCNRYLDVLTAEYGVIEVFAHSVKKITSKNAGSTSLFSYSGFCLSVSGGRCTINSSCPKYNFHRLSGDIFALSLAVYFAEAVKYTNPEHLEVKSYSPHGESVLDLLLITLYELEQKKIPLKQIKAVFELKLSSMVGFMPDLRACEACACYEADIQYFLPESGNIYCADCFNDRELYSYTVFIMDKTMVYTLRHIIYSVLKKVYKFNINEKYIGELSEITEKYLLLHIDKSFKTLEYFKGILNGQQP